MSLGSRTGWYVGCVASFVVFEIGAWSVAPAHRHIWADVCWIAVDLFATWTCLRTAMHARPPLRRAWWCFTIALACWSLGMLVWAYYELVIGQLTPFPSIVDVLGWLGAPFLVAGIFLYKAPQSSRALGLKQSADLALTGAAIVAVAVALLYAPAIGATHPLSYIASALVTPVIATTAVVFGLLSVWQHLGGPRRFVLLWIVGGVFLLATVSVLYAEALLGGRYRAGAWIDGLWVLAFLAIATGAREERRLGATFEARPPAAAARFDALVPGGTFVVWMAACVVIRGLDNVMVINAITGVVLAISLFFRVLAMQRLERGLAAQVAKEEFRALQLEVRLARAHKLEAIGTLAGGVAHDFNNVLAAATGGLKMSRRKLERGEPVADDLLEIEAVLFRASDLTGRLLDLARKREPDPVVIDPRKAIDRVRVLLEKVLPSGVRLVIEGGAVPPIVADAGGLEHALLNLGLNARDAVRDHGGTIAIRAGAAGESVVLEVSDDGPGIAAELIDHVFEPFFSTKSEEGTGLGLAMVEAFASANGGRVSVASAPGRTTFCLVFPAASVAVPASMSVPSATVLVIAREDASGLATAAALERAGITAIVARDTTAARAEFARLERIDAIVVDAATGRVGRDAMQDLRSAGAVVASVLLSAPGGDDAGDWTVVVSKPVDPRVLVEQVRHAIATRVAGSEPRM